MHVITLVSQLIEDDGRGSTVDAHRRERAGFEWLARAQDGPEHVQEDWRERGISVLPTGSRFCAVRLPADLVHAAVGTRAPEQLAEALAELLDGPVIADYPGHTYYALIKRMPRHLWEHNFCAPLMGAGSFVGVPARDLRGPTGVHWTVPPRGPGDLCEPAAVSALVVLGCASKGTGQ